MKFNEVKQSNKPQYLQQLIKTALAVVGKETLAATHWVKYTL